jgi:predicted enzyme related to lactoylglutathione lyase
MSNSFVWVDIPVVDLARAISFYSAVLGSKVTQEGGPGFQFGLLPHAGNEVAGCLYVSDGENAPSKTGPLVYLNVEGRLEKAVQSGRPVGWQSTSAATSNWTTRLASNSPG